jgi:uncharacterized protein YdaU (DUF1376 family)
MPRAPFMQLFPADFLSGTLHLTTEQVGAYTLIFLAMWTAGGSLPNDPAKLARIARLSPQRWARVGADVLQFFQHDGDAITQERLKRDIEKVYSIVEKRSAAGKLGNEAKLLKSRNAPPANANAKRKRSERILELEPELEPESKEEKYSQLAMPVVISEPVKGKGRRRKKSAPIDLPDDFVFSDRNWNFGSQLGLTADQIQASQTKLKRWAKSQGKRCADWDPFIESWLEREVAFLRQHGRGAAAVDDRSSFDEFLNGADHHG